jgi:two-component system LytT family response regulator
MSGDSISGDASPVRAVVVDDEPGAREVVLTLLAEHERVRVVGEATNGREAVEVVRRTRPDLLFLDIEMPDDDGFRVLEALGADVPRGIVFVTAHDEHAIRAFDVHALDYVLKPFGRPRFRAAVDRALERLSALDALTLRRTLASIASDRTAAREPAGELSLSPASEEGRPEERPAEERPGGHVTAHRPRPRRLGVRTGTKVVLVDVDAIDWVEAYGDYARIHAGAAAHLVSQRMHALEQMLESGDFVRIHRSLIVNLTRVREMHRESDGGGTIVLSTGVRLRVARGRWESLQSALRMEEF